MSTAKKRGLILLMACIISIMLFNIFNKYYSVQPAYLTLGIKSDRADSYQVYYDTDGSKEWKEVNSTKDNYEGSKTVEDLTFRIPVDAKNIRIDFGTMPSNITMEKFSFEKGNEHYISIGGLNGTSENLYLNIDGKETPSIPVKLTGCSIYNNSNALNIKVESDDSYMEIENADQILSGLGKVSTGLRVLMIVGSIVLGLIIAKSLMWIKGAIQFVSLSIKNKMLIGNLSKNDFRNKYATSYLGIIWGFVQPLITIGVYWFVFQIGFRSGNVGDTPYIIWFIAGIVPWFFFSEALSSTTNVFIEYSYLVKKVVFKIEILPVVKIVSALFVHLFFILFIYVIMAVYGIYPDLCSLQFIYYCIALIVLVYAVCIFTSSVILFFRDLGQIVNIILNVGFWATPIGWQLSMLPDNIARLFKLNPLYYIVTGYRDAFVDKIYFWQRPYETLYFWAFCLVILLISVKVFNKLKPHFSDVI
ncbi:MAG: ABC transporter permease [Clostridium sp.]|nr:ABC transporter permease [Clostridium sp.]